MRFVIPAIALLVFAIPHGAEAAVALVQDTGNTVSSGSTIAITVSSTGTGNLLIVATANNNNRTVTKVCTDGATCAAGNSFTQVPGSVASNGNRDSDAWYLLSSTSGVTTVTVTYSGTLTDGTAFFWEVSGFTNPVLDTVNIATGSGVANIETGASVTTTSTTGFIAAIDNTNGSVDQNPRTGNEFTGGASMIVNGNGGVYLISTTAEAHQPVWHDSTDLQAFSSVTVAFKEDVSSITISGTCKQADQSTDCTNTAGNSVRIAVNGTIQAQTDATVDGSWSISSVTAPSADDIITVFIQGEASSSSQAVAVTKYGGSGSVGGIELIEAHLSIGSNQRNTITNTNLSQYDSSVSGKKTFFDVNSGVLTVDVDAKVASEELYVKGGNTYQPDSNGGDTINTHDVEINGTFDLDTNVVAASGSWDNNGKFLANTGSVSFTGIGSEAVTNVASAGYANGFYHLKIDSPNNGGTLTFNDKDVIASGQISVGTGDTLSISSGKKLTHTGTTLVLSGTISGAGRFVYRSTTAFPSTGTISSILVFDAQGGNQTMSNRTYEGQVEVTNNSTSSARTVTMSSSTHTLSSNLYVVASTSQNITLAGATNDPTVDITGDLDFTGAGSGTEAITSGANTWTVSGDVDFTSGTFTVESGNTLDMDGLSKTLTSNAQTLENLTLSGTITLANATHTVGGNLNMANGNITAGSSTITMTGTSNTITGGGETLNNLTINPSSTGTITLQTSDLTVSGQVIVAAGDTFAINSGRTLTLSGSGTPLLLFSTSVFSPNSASTVQYTGTSATTIAPATYGILSLVPAGTATYTLGSASSQIIGATGLFTIGNGSNAVTVTAATKNPTINLSNNFTIATGAIFASGSGTTNFKSGGTQTLTDSTTSKQNLGEIRVSANGTNTTLILESSIRVASASIDTSQILSVNGTHTVTINGAGNVFTNNGTFKPSTGTVQYTGTSANVTATKYNNLTLGGTGTYTGPSSGTTTLLGDLVITSGATYASGSSTLFFREGGPQSITDNNSIKRNFGEIAVQASTSGNTTLTLGSSIRIASATIDAAQTLDSNGSNTLTITDVGTPLTVNGTFTRSTGVVVFTGNSATNIPALNYYDLKVQPSANNITHTFLAGTASVSKTFTVGNGTNTGIIITANGASTGLDVASVSISANSTLVAHPSNEFTVGGNWRNNGSLTHSSGTVTFASPLTASISGATIFNNFTSTTVGKKIKFGAGQAFGFDGSLTITGIVGNTIKIESTASASQWLANFSGVQSGVSYATITNSGCVNSSASVTLDSTSINGGNNGTCWFMVNIPRGGGGGGASEGGAGGGTPTSGGGNPGGGEGASEGEAGGDTPTSGGGNPGGGGGSSPVMFYIRASRF